jgi:RNA polymerase sigma factor for flagellar operon FliA
MFVMKNAAAVMADGDLKKVWETFLSSSDDKSRKELAYHYLPMVDFIIGRLAMNLPPHIDRDDLENIGVIGLLNAIDNFDPEREVKFETYASIRIKGAIIDHLRKEDWLSRPLRKKALDIERASEELRGKLKRTPTFDEIAKQIGMSEEEVSETIHKSTASHLISIEKELYDDEEGVGRSLGDYLADTTNLNPHDETEKSLLISHMIRAIGELPEKERKVLNLYYFEELTLKEIGALLNVSESRVCQIHSRAVFLLRDLMKL